MLCRLWMMKGGSSCQNIMTFVRWLTTMRRKSAALQGTGQVTWIRRQDFTGMIFPTAF